MADTRITDLTAITGANTAAGDQFVLVDVSDTTMAASGTDKKITKTELLTVFEAAGAAAAAQAASQPLDSDLTAIAALATTAYGRAFLTLANQAATMALLSAASETASGIVELATNAETATGTDTARAVTPANVASVLASYLTTAAAAAGYQPLDSDLTSIAALTTTAYGRAFLALADQAALMALLSASSDTASGIVELATTAETTTGTDAGRAVTPAGLLNATTASNINARIGVEKAGVLVGTRRAINFIEGSNVTLTVADDAGNEEVDITIAASGGGSGAPAERVAHTNTAAYYGPVGFGHAQTAQAAATYAGFACWWPFFVDRAVTVSDVFNYCWTLEAGSTMRAALYTSSTNAVPVTLLADYSTMSGASAGIKSVTGTQSVGPGLFFVGLWTPTANTTVRWSRYGISAPYGLYGDNAVANGRQQGFWATSATVDYSAGFPASAPAVILRNQSDHIAYPMPLVRYS